MAKNKKRKFPYLGAILLVFSVLWLLRELNIVESSIPWIPIVLIIIAMGMIINKIT